jgi:NADH:ubiquinone oxidoreductase subunit F (NADH-binding)
MVISDEFNIPEIAARTIQFYNHESCGQCTPCRLGSGMIVNLLNKVVGGKGEHGDLDKILWFCDNIKGNTLCPTGEAYSSPIKAMINKYRNEFEQLITNK